MCWWRDRRCCVKNRVTGERRLELQAQNISVPKLHVVSDRATMDGLAGSGRAGSFAWDEPHKDWTGVCAALDLAGLRPFRLCLTTLLNFSAGPWDGAANLSNLRDGSKLYIEHGSMDDELFDMFLPWLSREIGTGGTGGLRERLGSTWWSVPI